MECNNCEIFEFLINKFLFFPFFVMKRHENRWPTVNYPVRSTQNFFHRSRPVARVDWWPSKWKPNNPSKVNAQFIVTFIRHGTVLYLYVSVNYFKLLFTVALRSLCYKPFRRCILLATIHICCCCCAQKAQQRTHGSHRHQVQRTRLFA